MHQVGRATYEAYMIASGCLSYPAFCLLEHSQQEAWRKAEIAGLQASMRSMAEQSAEPPKTDKCSAEHPEPNEFKAIADGIDKAADQLIETQNHSALQRASVYRRIANVLREPDFGKE